MKELLKKYNQEHLFKYYNKLTKDEMRSLEKQISSIDFDEINNLINAKEEVTKDLIRPMKSEKPKRDYRSLGIDAVKNNQYAYITMAGGQGTRLGHTGPKGTFILKYGINKSLFELICDRLKKIYKDTNVYISWYIMTSPDNNNETIKFFKENNYFNYPSSLIKFFIQEEMPMVDLDRKVILSDKHTIKMGANGSGGVFSSFENSGYLKEIKDLGIKWIFISGIDNPLIPVDCYELIGFSIKNKYKVSSLVVDKLYPEEKVGVFVYKNNKPSVIEYINMSKEQNNARDKKGVLLYKDAHILINLFSIDVLDKISDKKLPYHKTIKDAYSYIDKLEIKAYKFETFIFDAFKYVDKVGLLSGVRKEVYAPIKNKEGLDSPESSAKLYKDYFN